MSKYRWHLPYCCMAGRHLTLALTQTAQARAPSCFNVGVVAEFVAVSIAVGSILAYSYSLVWLMVGLGMLITCNTAHVGHLARIECRVSGSPAQQLNS